MSWFNKSKKDEGELPALPELPPMNDKFSPMNDRLLPSRNELTPLPSFPGSSTGEKISNQAVKQAIRGDSEDEEISEDEQFIPPKIERLEPRKIMAKEIESWQEQKIRPAIKEMKPFMQKIEPIYIRLDKYQDSLSDMQEVKRKILEIENLLKSIKEIKSREDQELAGWEEEIQEAKGKLDNIDKTIFEKLD